jgi:hypothetical protein
LLLIILSLALLANAARADRAITVTTNPGSQSPVETSVASCEDLAMIVQMLEFLLVVVLIVAAVALFFLIRLYRRTKF